MIVQLMNKKHQGDIEELDVASLESLLPAIAEILSAADETMRVVSIAAGLAGHMGEMRESITGKVSYFMADTSMPMNSTSVRYMGDLIKMMVGNKKRTVFSDPSIMQEVFREIKDGQAYQDQLFHRHIEAREEVATAMK
jgi:hypothetical protein